MTQENATTWELPDRSSWAVCFAAVEQASVQQLADELAQRYSARAVKPAISGLGMLQLSDSVMQQGFHIGEFTVSSAMVELSNQRADTIYGGAVIMRDDEQLAFRLAVLDAVLAHTWEGHEQVCQLLQAGHHRRCQVEQQRKLMLSLTSVEFSTLDEDV